jgi:hypothetical protein
MGAMQLLEQPGDTYQASQPAGSFLGFFNGSSPDGEPVSGPEYNRLLNANNRIGIQPRPGSDYAFINAQQSCDSLEGVNDQRIVMASQSNTFGPGETRRFAFAMMASDSTGSCPNMDFSRIGLTADTAYKLYWNPYRHTPVTTAAGVSNVRTATLLLYPNPATGTLHVESAYSQPGNPVIFNAVGSAVALPVTKSARGFDVNTSGLPAGVYTIRLESSTATETAIFVKE